MGNWLWPSVFVCVLLCAVSYWITILVGKKVEASNVDEDTPIHEVIADHPFLLNPIIIMYAIFFAFTGIMIFVYWASYL